MSAKDAALAARQNQLAALIADVFAPPIKDQPSPSTATSGHGQKKTTKHQRGNVSPSRGNDRQADLVFQVQATLDNCDTVEDAKAALNSLLPQRHLGEDADLSGAELGHHLEAVEEEDEEEGTEILDLTLDQLQELRELERRMENEEEMVMQEARDGSDATSATPTKSHQPRPPGHAAGAAPTSASPHRPKVETSPLDYSRKYAEDPTLRILPKSAETTPNASPTRNRNTDDSGEGSSSAATSSSASAPTDMQLTWGMDGELWWHCMVCRTENTLDEEVRLEYFPRTRPKEYIERVTLPSVLRPSSLLPLTAASNVSSGGGGGDEDVKAQQIARALKCYICESRPTPMLASEEG